MNEDLLSGEEWVGMEIKSKLDLNLSLYQRHSVEPFDLHSFPDNVGARGRVERKDGRDCYGDGRRHIEDWHRGYRHRIRKCVGETTKLFLFNVKVMKEKYSLEMTFLLDNTPTLKCNACFREVNESVLILCLVLFYCVMFSSPPASSHYASEMSGE